MAILCEIFSVCTNRIGVLFTRKRCVVRTVVSLFAFCIHCAFCVAPQMNRRLVELIIRLRIELIPDSTITQYRIGFMPLSERFHQNDMKHIGFVSSRVNRGPTRYEVKTVSFYHFDMK